MELEDKELDAAVALALGWEHPGAVGKYEPTTDGTPWCRSGCNDWWRHPVSGWLCGGCYCFPYEYSSDWSIGGPLVDSEKIDIDHMQGRAGHLRWRALCGRERSDGFGSTALVAAMRAFVRSKTPNEKGNRPA